MTKRVIAVKISILCLLICPYLVGCNNTQTTEKNSNVQSVTVRLVHGPELRAYLSSMREQFSISNPKLANGASFRIELISDMGLSAAVRIARGDLKTEAWLAPSGSFVNYTNNSRINLGPEQIECTVLFKTPIVLAAKQDQVGLAGGHDGKFSWKSLFSARAGSAPAVGSAFASSFSHTQPRASTTGLASLIQLAYFAAGSDQITLDSLKNPAVYAQLKALQGSVFSYPLSESFLLAKTASASGKRPRFALTTEQQLSQFNQQLTDNSQSLVALYPEEGSYMQDYQLCISNADWVNDGHRGAIRLLRNFLLSSLAQRSAAKLGFIPVTDIQAKPIEQASDSNKKNDTIEQNAPAIEVPLTPTKILPPVTGDIVSYLLQVWPEIRRPAAIILVLDSSGSMEGDSIEVGKEQFRKLLAQSSPNDLKGLVTFNSDPYIISRLTNAREQVIPKLDSIVSLGGSAVYDGIRSAIELASDQKLTSYRKLIVVYTDGDDKNSSVSLSSLLGLIHQRFETNDINLIIVGIDREGLDYSDLEHIAQDSDGTFRKSSLYGMESVFQEISKSF